MTQTDTLPTGHALWSLLQISDQQFPTGAYTFSHALETYVQEGLVHDRTSCQQLLTTLCTNALGPCDVVFCRAAYRHARAGDLAALTVLDRLLTAQKTARELRQESQHTGKAFLRASLALTSKPLLMHYLQAIQEGHTPGNHAIAFGLVAQCVPLPEESAMHAYAYNVIAGLIAAAVRLVPLGQSDGQRLLHDLAPILIETLQTYQNLTPDEAWSCTPGLDIRSMQHERLYSRLFRS